MKISENTHVLIIMDGWGIGPRNATNAVYRARTPFLDALWRDYPHTQLQCSGEAVGLPPGFMGNSEVGHLNIGAGRVVYQELLRINKAIADGSFETNPAFTELLQKLRQDRRRLHLLGLVSDGGVHSHINHIYALLETARKNGVADTLVHVITDGRDTPPDSGAGYVAALQAHMDKTGYGRIATVCGRFYAMDRDTRWERVEKAYRLYTRGEGVAESDPVEAVQNAYGRGETDEFIKPILITAPQGGEAATVSDGDGVICFNFRADRVREITRAFTQPDFSEFPVDPRPQLADWVCMTLYDEHFTLPVAFKPVHLENILGQVVSAAGLQQLRIAETEKYAHVTYFFNGGEEKPFPGEDRCLVPSPRDVATYDQKPEMSAPRVTGELLKRLGAKDYGLVVLNFANGDMVGHTGVLSAAITACETVDRCVGEIVEAVRSGGGHVFITADHGNAETMADENGNPHTAHTLNPVPFIMVDARRRNQRLREGVLGDIAPTLLEVMGIAQPPEMTGKSMIIQ